MACSSRVSGGQRTRHLRRCRARNRSAPLRRPLVVPDGPPLLPGLLEPLPERDRPVVLVAARQRFGVAELGVAGQPVALDQLAVSAVGSVGPPRLRHRGLWLAEDAMHPAEQSLTLKDDPL